MIEYCHTGNTWNDVTDQLLTGINVSNLTFDLYKLRIDGIVYGENTEEFRIAYNKAIFWSKLSD